MNWKTVGILVGLFILLNVGIFFLVNQKSIKTQYNPTSTLGPQLTQGSDSITLPAPQNHKGVSLSRLIYGFQGKVVKKQLIGENTKLVLDISDPTIPDFIVTKDTKVFKPEGTSATTPGTIDDVIAGLNVYINMTYDIKTKTWNLKEVYITGTSQTPTPSPK